MIADSLGTITIGSQVATGCVRIYAKLDPSFVLESESEVYSKAAGRCCDVELQPSTAKFSVDVSDSSAANQTGRICGAVEIGAGESFDSVAFHFLRFPSIGREVLFPNSCFPRLAFQSDHWNVVIDVQNQGGFEAIGTATKTDRKPICAQDAKQLIDCLGQYLAFAFGDWCPPLIPVGIKNDKVVWRLAQRFVVGQSNFDRGWIDTQHPHTTRDISRMSIEQGYSGFEKMYRDDKWAGGLHLAISLLCQAASPETDREVATVISQIPVEMIIGLSEVKCNAACGLAQLLNKIGLTHEVPDSLASLKRVAARRTAIDVCQGKGDRVKCDTCPPTTRGIAPRVVVDIRNCLVHPNENNREKLVKYVNQSDSSLGVLLAEVTQLLNRYTTLAILHAMQSNRQYYDRISGEYLSISEK